MKPFGQIMWAFVYWAYCELEITFDSAFQDATELVSKAKTSDFDGKIFIDQGGDDQFLKDQQLLPENFVEAAKKNGISCEYKLREGYDHSYFFISTFVQEHFAFHKKFMNWNAWELARSLNK